MLEALAAIMVTRSFSESPKCQIHLLNGLWAFHGDHRHQYQVYSDKVVCKHIEHDVIFLILFVNVLYRRAGLVQAVESYRL